MTLHLNLRHTTATLALMATWLLFHAYQGLEHDARLYLLQALHLLDPDRFQQDLFFLGGTQDSFTLFSNLHAWTIQALGVNDGNLTLYFSGHLLWVGGTVLLFRRLTNGGWAWWCALLLATAPGGYGTRHIFHYGENFLVARTLAEALCIIALLGWLSPKARWRRTGWGISLLGMAMHPISGAAGFALGILLRWGGHPGKLGIGLLAGMAPLLIAGWLGLPFVDRLTSTMSVEWFETISTLSPQLAMTAMTWYDVSRLLLDAALLLHAALLLTEHRRLIIFIGILATLGLGTSLILGDWLRVQLIVQMQSWRVLWLTRYLMLPLIALLGIRLARQGWSGRVMLLWYAIAWVELEGSRDFSAESGGMLSGFGGILALTVAACAWFAHLRPSTMEKPLTRLLALVATLCMLGVEGILLTDLASVWWHRLWHPAPPSTLDLRHLTDASLPWLPPLLLAGGVALHRLGHRWLQVVVLGLMIGLGGLGVLMMDHRSEQNKQFEQKSYRASGQRTLFDDRIPLDATVYWEESVEPVWFLLGRSNYAGRIQAGQLLFSEEKTKSYRQRVQRLARLGVPEGRIAPWWAQYQSIRLPSEAALIHLCHDPDLDYAILVDRPWPHKRLLPQRIAANTMAMNFNWLLYDCQPIRQHHPDPGPPPAGHTPER
ncbi:MAG: hypothetical protein HQM02_09370 [Magnetococcales bacterium]|nr:hypothetical protein [Magnetococcales bacterium]